MVEFTPDEHLAIMAKVSARARALGKEHKVRTKHVETEVVYERGLRPGDRRRVMATLKQLQGRKFDPERFERRVSEGAAGRGEAARRTTAGRRP